MKKIFILSFFIVNTVWCIAGVCPGDFNKDGMVTAADLNLLVPKFQQDCPSCIEDINGDGKVSAADLNLLIPQFGIPCNFCNTDASKNSVSEIVYDEDNSGTVISETKAYTDKLGRGTQSLVWNVSDNVILGTQSAFDALGRSTLQTLSAPVKPPVNYSANTFCYTDLFISNGNNTSYSYTDFDLDATTLNTPNQVNNSNSGTLGWYYSNNNTSEPYVAASAYPYNRTELYRDPMNRVKRVAGVGENYRMGSGHEQQLYYMSNAGELYYAFGYKGAAIVGLEDNGAYYKANENLNAAKTVAVDADGKVSVSYQTLSGLTIATCRSGVKEAGCINQKVKQIMPYSGERGVNIHLPPSCNATLKITGVTESDANPKASYQITDLSTGKVLTSGVGNDYTFDRITRAVTFSSNYQNKHLFLRISYDYMPGTQPNYWDYLTVAYELDYDNWSLQLYDTKGQPTVTVPPAAIICNYDVDVNKTLIQDINKYPLEIYPFNYELETATLNPVPNYDKNLFYTITSPSVYFGNREIQSRSTTYTTEGVSATSNTPDVESSEIDWPEEPSNAPAFTDLPDNPDIRLYRGALAVTFKLYSNNVPLPIDPGVLYLDVTYLRNYSIAPPGNPYTIKSFDSIPGVPVYFAVPNELIKNNNYTNIVLWVTDIKASPNNYRGANAGAPYIYYTDYNIAYDTSITNKIINKFVETQKINVGRELLSYPTPTPYNKSLITSTFYNKLGWPIKTVSPDEGTVNIVYNTEGKVRFTQNQQQLADGGKFTYINYDRAGREVETGEYDPLMAGLPGTPSLSFVPYTAGGGIPAGSGNVHSIVDQLDLAEYGYKRTQQTYFNYDLPQADFPAALTGYDQNYKDGQLVKTSNSNGSTWYGYDVLGQTTWKVNTINGLGTKTVNYSYTNEGQLDKLDYQKETSAERFVHQYLYDNSKRFKEVKTSFDNVNFSSNQALKYYLHGALKRTELGGTLQGMDYVYTITGQLKSMNDPGLTDRDPGKDGYTGTHSAFKKDVFGYTLDYFTGDYVRQNSLIETYTPGSGNTALPNLYGGQIRSMRWQTTPASGAVNLSTHINEILQYTYKYDVKNQLSEAIFGTITQGTMNGTTSGTSPVFAEQVNEYRVNNLTYDRNGNIQLMNRKGKASALSMDQLTYHYKSGLPNRLGYIADAGGGTYTDDIKDQSSNVNNYDYYATGQLKQDVQAGYLYTYNKAGNVEAILKSGINHLSFQYNESGQRQRKTTYNTSGTAIKHTWYVYDAGGALLSTYETTAGVTTQTDLQVYGSGRLGFYDKATGNYIYELSDHLGNVRTTIRYISSGNIVLGFTDYYPHGSPIPGRNWIGSISSRNGNYQGQEKDGETGLLNFELRQYDPRIGRWFNPDPMGQYHSPYLAMGNNPISFIDPTGGEGIGAGADGSGFEGDRMPSPNSFGSNNDWWWAWNTQNYFSLSTDLFEKRQDLRESYLTDLHVYWGKLNAYNSTMKSITSRSVPSIDGQEVKYPKEPSRPANDATSVYFCSICPHANNNSVADFYDAKIAMYTIWNSSWWYWTMSAMERDLKAGPPTAVQLIVGINPLAAGYNAVNGIFGDGTNIMGQSQSKLEIGINIGTIAIPALGELRTVVKSSKALNGSFSILDWKGYPTGGIKPTGPFRLLTGAEYATARNLANKTNAGLRRANPEEFIGLHIHEIHPVKFGGSPTAISNKIFLTPSQHAEYTNFWNGLMRSTK